MGRDKRGWKRWILFSVSQLDCAREGTRMGWRRPTVEGLKGLAKNEHPVLNVKVKGDSRLKMTFLQRLEY